jgi:hypothetical protein
VKLQRVLSIPEHGESIDTETSLIADGLLAPELVCGSTATFRANEEDQLPARIYSRQEILDKFLEMLRDPKRVLCGANIAYDIPILAHYLLLTGYDPMPEIFQAFEDGRIYDLQLAEALHAIAEGHHLKDPRTGGSLFNPETGKKGGYSLATCVDLNLGRIDAKKNDAYRQRYAEFIGVPMEEWPPEAIEYPKDDGRNQIEVPLAQIGHLPKTSPHHTWSSEGVCQECGATEHGESCVVARPHRNLVNLKEQVYAAFCLQLGAIWGFRINQTKVDVIERYAVKKRAKGIGPFLEVGLIRPDGSENRSDLKKRIAIAYGSTEPCKVCEGTGKVLAPNPKKLRCPDCKGRSAPWKGGGKIKEPTVASCARCESTGKIIDIRHRVGCQGPEEEATCDSTGLTLSSDVPRAKAEGIAYGADSLHESGDDFLMSYGDFGEDGKWLKDYIPYLRMAREPIAPHPMDCPLITSFGKEYCTCPGPYQDIPLTLKYNPLLETGRVSARDYIMLLPRWPGFIDKPTKEYIPSFRECFEPIGMEYETVEVPDDYVLQVGEFKC